MNLPDLIAELQRVPYNHRLTCTNVDRVSIDGCDVVLETDVSHLQDELDDANRSIKLFEAEEKEHDEALRLADERADKLEEELTELRELMADLKDPESGVSLIGAIEAAKKAKQDADNAHAYAKRFQAELTALRKRKGIEPELFANGRALITLVRDLAHRKEYDNHALRPRAEELSNKINGYVPWSMPQ